MAVEYTNKRGRVNALPQAPAVAPAPVVQVATPKVAQPAEPVRAVRPEQTSLGQVANSLAFFNENLRSFGEVYTRISNKENYDQGQQMAMEDLQKARQVTKLGFKKASEQGLIDPGANPYMRLGLYETTGKLAGQDYREALLKRRDEVNSPYSKLTEDQVIAEERQKFMAQMGDNFYSQQGFLGEANTAEQSFKNAVISEKAKFVEVETREKDALAITKQVALLTQQVTPEDKANALNGLKDLYNRRSEYAPNVNALMSQDLGNAIRALSKQDPEKAQQALDAITTMVITRRDGSTASFGEVIAPVVDEVQNTIDSDIYKRGNNWERIQKDEDNRAEISIDEEIKKLIASKANLLDPSVTQSVIDAVMLKNDKANVGSVSQKVITQLAQVSAPAQAKAIEDVYRIAQTNPSEAVQAVKDRIGISISWEEGQKLLTTLGKANDNLQLINSPSANAYYKILSDGFKTNDMYNSLSDAEAESFVIESRAVFDSKVSSFLQSLDPNMPNTEVNKLLRQELPKITKETKDELFKTQTNKALETQAFLSPRMKNELKTGATDPKVNPVAEWKLSSLVFPSPTPNPNEILLSRWDRIEQLQNQLDVAKVGSPVEKFNTDKALGEQKELKNFMAEKSQNYMYQLGKLIINGGVEVSDMFGDDKTSEFYTFTPEQLDKYKADFMKIKGRLGFSSSEIANGVTAEGVEFDPKSLPLGSALLFNSTEEARIAWNDYQKAVKTDSNGFTTFEGSAKGYYIQTLIDLYGIKDEASLGDFIANQKLKLELLGK
jgi:hypothetical protein